MSQPLTFFQSLRYKLALPETSIHVCALGLIGGLCSATIIVLFRLGIDVIQQLWGVHAGNYSELAVWERFVMPIVGVAFIVGIAKLTGFKHYRLGIPFVIHRIKTHFGLIPLRTTINQFFGGMIALASGFVVGREGPSVHLGAASSSFLGQWFKLPYNSIKILAGCGIAAGISASFNTPLAAVIFVMEVVLREYRIHIFVPVMLSAACGSVLTRIVFGDAHELYFLSFASFSQWMYAYLILVGIVLGGLATLFNSQLMNIMRLFRPVGMAWRLVLAAILTGVIGSILPESMGADFESIRTFFDSSPDALLIGILLAMKMFMAIIAIGLGIPGGIIGPVMLIGMLAGALLLSPLSGWLNIPDYVSSFALLGLAGMLTAVLHAPLAALTAVMELSHSPEIILPAIFVIVPAYVTSTQLFKNRSIFIQQLDYQKLSYSVNPVRESLEKIGVLAAMETNFKQFYDAPDKAIAEYLSENPTAIVIQQNSFEIESNFKLAQYDMSLDRDSVPFHFTDMEGLSAQTTLAEGYDQLRKHRSGAVYIYDTDPEKIIGVLTWSQIQKHLQHTQY